MAGDSNNYWPGYVDALVNTVLNVTFLLSIFVLGLFVVATTGKIGSAKDALAPTHLSKSIRLPSLQQVDEKTAPTKSFKIESIRSTSAGILYKISATQNTDKKDFDGLVKRINETDSAVLIWSEVDLESSYFVNLAYQNNIAVLKKFVENGISPDRVESRIYNSLTPYRGTTYILIKGN